MSSSFDYVPRGAALEARQRFGLYTGTSLSGYLGPSWMVVVHSTSAFLGMNDDGVG